MCTTLTGHGVPSDLPSQQTKPKCPPMVSLFFVPGKINGLRKSMDSEERLARSCQSFPLLSNAGCTYLGLSDSMGRLNGGQELRFLTNTLYWETEMLLGCTVSRTHCFISEANLRGSLERSHRSFLVHLSKWEERWIGLKCSQD